MRYMIFGSAGRTPDVFREGLSLLADEDDNAALVAIFQVRAGGRVPLGLLHDGHSVHSPWCESARDAALIFRIFIIRTNAGLLTTRSNHAMI